MQDYEKPVVFDGDDETPTPMLFPMVNAFAFVNVVAAINGAFAVNIYVRGISIDTYSAKVNVL